MLCSCSARVDTPVVTVAEVELLQNFLPRHVVAVSPLDSSLLLSKTTSNI
jgi:hypothetical protein